MSNYNGLCYNEEEKIKYERHNNNCYTYAINQPLNPYSKSKYLDYAHCQPGYLGGKGIDPGCDIKPNDKLIDLAITDLNNIGYELIKSSYEEYIKDQECWKVAFCYCSADYHWYRQNIDGTWSHKKGTHAVTNIDDDGNIIYNPETCNRGRYTEFVGFYIIRKKSLHVA